MPIEVKGLEGVRRKFTQLKLLDTNINVVLEEHVIVPLFNTSLEAFKSEKSAFDGTRWSPLSEQTLKAKKGKGKILFNTGNLQNRFFWQVKNNKGVVGTNATKESYPYPAVHQFGSKKQNIERRAFLPIDNNGNLSQKEIEKIEQALKSKIDKLLST